MLLQPSARICQVKAVGIVVRAFVGSIAWGRRRGMSSSATSSLTRIEPVSPLAAGAGERAPSRSLATRARHLRGHPPPPWSRSSPRAPLVRARPAATRRDCAGMPSCARCAGARGESERAIAAALRAAAVTDLVGRRVRVSAQGGVSRSKRLWLGARIAQAQRADRGSMRVSELAVPSRHPRPTDRQRIKDCTVAPKRSSDELAQTARPV